MMHIRATEHYTPYEYTHILELLRNDADLKAQTQAKQIVPGASTLGMRLAAAGIP